MNGTTSKSKPRWRRKRFIIAAIIAALAIPAASYAAWLVYTSTVSGTGTAQITATGPTAGGDVLTFVPIAGSGTIVPGSGTATALKVSVTNHNNVAETINSLAAPAISDDAGGGHAGQCASHVTFSGAGAVGQVVPVGTSTITIPNAVTMDGFAQGFCTSVNVTFTFAPGSGTTSP